MRDEIDPAAAVRLERLIEFLQSDPENLALRHDAVRVASHIGHWPVARELIEVGLRMHPEEPVLLALCGSAYLQQQRYADAERVFYAALELGVEPAEVRYNLAFALFMQKRYAEALSRLSSALLPFELPMVLKLRAQCHHHLQQWDGAIADCEHYLAIADDAPEVHGLLALLWYEQGRTQEAHRHVDAALKANPQEVQALLAKASLLADAREFDPARRCFDTLLRIDPKCGRGWLGRALLEMSEMNLGAATLDVERAAEQMPEHIGTWHILAWCHLLLGDVAPARAAFERAHAIDRNFSETHGGLATIAALEGHDDAAQQSIKRALRLDPQCLSARYAQLLLLQRSGDLAGAHAVFDSVLESPAGQSAMTYRNLVAMQARRLNLDGASRRD